MESWRLSRIEEELLQLKRSLDGSWSDCSSAPADDSDVISLKEELDDNDHVFSEEINTFCPSKQSFEIESYRVAKPLVITGPCGVAKPLQVTETCCVVRPFEVAEPFYSSKLHSETAQCHNGSRYLSEKYDNPGNIVARKCLANVAIPDDRNKSIPQDRTTSVNQSTIVSHPTATSSTGHQIGQDVVDTTENRYANRSTVDRFFSKELRNFLLDVDNKPSESIELRRDRGELKVSNDHREKQVSDGNSLVKTATRDHFLTHQNVRQTNVLRQLPKTFIVGQPSRLQSADSPDTSRRDSDSFPTISCRSPPATHSTPISVQPTVTMMSTKRLATMTSDEVEQIEMFYRSHETIVVVCRCIVSLYLGYTKSPKVVDGIPSRGSTESLDGWTFIRRGVPVLVLDSGDGRRQRRLHVVLAERGSGFILWKDSVDHLTNYTSHTEVMTFHTMHLSNDHTRLAGFIFDDTTAASLWHQQFVALTSDPDDTLLNLFNGQSSKKKNLSHRTGVKATKKVKVKPPSKADISSPCCFTHVTRLNRNEGLNFLSLPPPTLDSPSGRSPLPSPRPSSLPSPHLLPRLSPLSSPQPNR